MTSIVSRKQVLSERKSRWRYELIFVGPMFLAIFIVKILPMVLSLFYSLTDWNGISSTMGFAGLQNFIDLFSDKRYWQSMGFTFRLGLVALVISNLLGFGLAYLLTKRMRMRNMLRAAFYIPNTLGGLVVGFIWKFIFLSLFKYIYEKTNWIFFGLPWLSTPETSFWAMVMVQVWVLCGYLMLLYIAGLTEIPTDTIEAALIDGASGWQTLVRIKLPLLLPTITRCLFLSFLTCMRVYDINISLTGGNPFRTSESVTMNIYATAFNENSMAYGCAKALIFVIIVVGLSSLQVHLTSKYEEDVR